jgi:hypothetical protein
MNALRNLIALGYNNLIVLGYNILVPQQLYLVVGQVQVVLLLESLTRSNPGLAVEP